MRCALLLMLALALGCGGPRDKRRSFWAGCSRSEQYCIGFAVQWCASGVRDGWASAEAQDCLRRDIEDCQHAQSVCAINSQAHYPDWPKQEDAN